MKLRFGIALIVFGTAFLLKVGVFLVHFPNFFLHIGKRVIGYFQQFGVFPESFAVSDSNLSIIDWSFAIFNGQEKEYLLE